MTHKTFVAFSSKTRWIAEGISEACKEASSSEIEFIPWSSNDTSGAPIDRSVYQWVVDADSVIADISDVNHNVTFEIGLAIGLGKPVRLIRASDSDFGVIERIGLLHNLGHDAYDSASAILNVLQIPVKWNWEAPRKNKDQPVYVFRSINLDNVTGKLLSGIKKTVRMKPRTFNPKEIDRLTSTEAFDEVGQSYGVVAVWLDSSDPNAQRENQRAAFICGLAKGMEIPSRLFFRSDSRMPLDLDDSAVRWSDPSDIITTLRSFRDEVADYQEDYVDAKALDERLLDRVYCGKPSAENEADALYDYFLPTEQFRLTMSGEINVMFGRKGTGKTAIFLQARDRVRRDKKNIVVDLQPEGYQLLKLKELIIDDLSLGTSKEFIAAFWEYIVWLEIAYKILEKDERRSRADSSLMIRFRELQEAYHNRVDTGSGDFSERLLRLTDRILERFLQTGVDTKTLTSSKTLEIIYGSEIRQMRDMIINYLKLKGIVFFLFDNIDRFRRSGAFDSTDALLITGLLEALKEIRGRFDRSGITFFWAVFIRSDVYEFVVRTTVDYGKLATATTEWSDKKLLLQMFQSRVMHSFGNESEWQKVWENVSVQEFRGIPILEFLAEASLMRPRYLIRLFETARRRAVTLKRDQILEEDYEIGLEELGWQVLDDFELELTDVIPAAESAILALGQIRKDISLFFLNAKLQEFTHDAQLATEAIDVLFWMGCLGVRTAKTTAYISDCGFRLAFLRSLIPDPNAEIISFHPTFRNIMSKLV